MQTRIESKKVIDRLMAAVGVKSERELSRYFGHGATAITNRRTRGNVPFGEAAAVALEKGLSLDYLIFGTPPEDEAPPAPHRGGHRGAPYARAARHPGLRGADPDDPQWRGYNRRAQDVLREVVIGVESALADSGLAMAPGKKAELIATLFELYVDAQAPPRQNHILRLVRSAS